LDSSEFIQLLNESQNLMKEEKYNEALEKLEILKQIEKDGDFDYSLTHKLYQLISNATSLLNQQIILKYVNQLSKKQKAITFQDLNKLIKNELDFDESILRREIELLILRGLLSCKIDGKALIF
jgi:hypothetical protein